MRRGATLISNLVGIGFLAVALAAVVQLYSLCSIAVDVADTRSVALMAAESQIERLHAKGYPTLPSIGEHGFDVPSLEDLPAADGEMTISRGPVPDSRVVTVTITWRQRLGRQESSVTLSRIIARGGMSR
jgi:hypothetical protein